MLSKKKKYVEGLAEVQQQKDIQQQKAKEGTAMHADKEREEEGNKGPLVPTDPQLAIETKDATSDTQAVSDSPIQYIPGPAIEDTIGQEALNDELGQP